jgi:tetratricopeptide (TPR) repeat protein
MNKSAKITVILVWWMILFTSCNDKMKEISPYDDLLSQPPFAALTDSIKKQPGRDDLHFQRGVLLNSNDYPEPALADFQKAWLLKKEERYAFGIGKILLDKKPDSAVAFLTTALKKHPESFLLKLTLARALYSQEKTEEALAVCNEILSVNPQQVDVLKLSADLLLKLGKTDESVKMLESAYALTPYDMELNFSLANSYAESNNTKVLALCDSLIRADTLGLHAAEPYYLKGIYYINTDDKSKALAQFNMAIQKNYQFLNAYIEKGRIQFSEKKYTEALKTFELASSIKSTFPDAYYWIGMCQEATGDNENAAVNYRRAYELDKGFTEAKKAMERLGKQ